MGLPPPLQDSPSMFQRSSYINNFFAISRFSVGFSFELFRCPASLGLFCRIMQKVILKRAKAVRNQPSKGLVVGDL
jgi:hypothetical protein